MATGPATVVCDCLSLFLCVCLCLSLSVCLSLYSPQPSRHPPPGAPRVTSRAQIHPLHNLSRDQHTVPMETKQEEAQLWLPSALPCFPGQSCGEGWGAQARSARAAWAWRAGPLAHSLSASRVYGALPCVGSGQGRPPGPSSLSTAVGFRLPRPLRRSARQRPWAPGARLRPAWASSDPPPAGRGQPQRGPLCPKLLGSPSSSLQRRPQALGARHGVREARAS